MKATKTMKILKSAAFLFAVSAFILLAVSCSNELLEKVEDDIGTFKEGDVLPAERKPIVSVFSVQGSSTTNNPTVNLNITAEALAVNDGGPATVNGYILKEIATTPLIGDSWTAIKPADFDFTDLPYGTLTGAHTLYLWVKDDFGNISDASSVGVTLAPLGASWENNYASGMVAAHEELIFTSLEDLQAGTAEVLVGGDLGDAIGVHSGGGNRTVTARPGASGTGLWDNSSTQTVTVRATTTYGLTLEKTVSINAFNAVCVSTTSGTSGSIGSRYYPLDTIQAGITKADALFTTGAVRVAAGTYTVDCGPSVYAANVPAGISLYGGYALTFQTRNPTGTPSIITDSDTVGGASELAPVRPVNFVDTATTTATEFDGFTINIGRMAGSHCGIYCNQASPTIRDVIIENNVTDDANAGLYSQGILLSQSSAAVQNCTINSGRAKESFGDWGISSGIFCYGTSIPSISQCTISGQIAYEVHGIRLESGSNASITQCTISGGKFTISAPAGTGRAIYCLGSNPTINNNTFGVVAGYAACAIEEGDASSNPIQLRNNIFNYNLGTCNYYNDYGGSIVTLANSASVTLSTAEGTALLFNLTWGNTHL